MVNLKSKLQKNQISVGSWISLGHPSIAEIMARREFDWLVVDMEHSAITLSEAQNLIQVIELAGCVPLVRVGENDSVIIKRVMDAGAHGVIVPMINSANDARQAVEAVKYPPIGKRGVGLARAQGYGLGFERYKKWVNKGSIVIVQIEHKDAITNLEEILSVEGVDGSIVGPYDMSASMGFPGELEKKEMKSALRRYIEVCGKYRKLPGIHVVNPDAKELIHRVREGFRFVAFGFDALFLATKCRDEMLNIKKSLK